MFKGLAAVDKLSVELEPAFGNLHGAYDLCESSDPVGMLSLMTAYRILDATGNAVLASGYLFDAVTSWRKSGGECVCQMLHRLLTQYISHDSIGSDGSPFQNFKPGPMTRPHFIFNNDSSLDTATSIDDTLLEDDTSQSENLETVTYVQDRCYC